MALRAPQTLQYCLMKEICTAQSMISFCGLSPLKEKGIKSFYDKTNRGFGLCFRKVQHFLYSFEWSERCKKSTASYIIYPILFP